MKKGLIFIHFLFIVFCQISYAQTGLDANTLALYNFDTPSNKIVVNEAGNDKLNGELFGNAKIVLNSGKYGGGLVLDGDGDYMKVPPFGNPEEGTVELWIKVPHANPSKNSLAPGVLWTITSACRDYGKSFDSPFILATHTGLAAPNLWFGIWTDKWNVADSGVDPKKLISEWHHIAGTWGKRGIEIYIDGKLAGINKDFKDALPDPSYEFWIIGSDSWKADIEGIIDGVRLSNKQRTATDLLLSLSVQPRDKLATKWAEIKY